MKYDAISLDTNIFVDNGYDLEAKLLKQLSQFKDGVADFVLSEVVVREVHQDLTEIAEKAKQTGDGVSRKLKKSNVLTEAAADQIAEIMKKAVQPKEAAEVRVKVFGQATGVKLASTETISNKKLMKLYFDLSPPFEKKQEKKNEFPDAIALLSLEAWAERNQKKILVVTRDKGWVAYADTSEWLDVQKDLATALQTFQDHTDEASAITLGFLKGLLAGALPEARKNIFEAVELAVTELDVDGTAYSGFEVDIDQIDMTFINYDFIDADEGFNFKIVRAGRNAIVAKVAINVEYTAEGHFSFSVRDSVDKDYVPMGSGTQEKRGEFEAAILITLEGNFSDPTTEVEVGDVELVEARESINFGDVEPDWEREYYEE